MRIATLTATLSLLMLALPVSGEAAVLYKQTDAVAPNWSPSDQFQVGQEQFNSETADDFSVPAGAKWTISTLDLVGKFNSTATLPQQVNVRIYANANNLPGPALYSASKVAAAHGPDYIVSLDGVSALTRGTYWISVQQTQAVKQMIGPDDEWLWQARNFESGQPAALRDSHCPNWGVRKVCLAGIAPPDQLFALEGDLISNRFKFRKPKQRPDGSLVLPVRFPDPGKVVVSDVRGSKLRIRRIETSVDAGRQNLLLEPTARSKAKLDSGVDVKVKLKAKFTPDGYVPHTQRKVIKLAGQR